MLIVNSKCGISRIVLAMNRTFVISLNGSRLLSYDTSARRLNDITGANPIRADVLAGNVTLVVALFEDCSFALFELMPMPAASQLKTVLRTLATNAPFVCVPHATMSQWLLNVATSFAVPASKPATICSILSHMQWGSVRSSVATPLHVSLRC